VEGGVPVEVRDTLAMDEQREPRGHSETVLRHPRGRERQCRKPQRRSRNEAGTSETKEKASNSSALRQVTPGSPAAQQLASFARTNMTLEEGVRFLELLATDCNVALCPLEPNWQSGSRSPTPLRHTLTEDEPGGSFRRLSAGRGPVSHSSSGRRAATLRLQGFDARTANAEARCAWLRRSRRRSLRRRR